MEWDGAGHRASLLCFIPQVSERGVCGLLSLKRVSVVVGSAATSVVLTAGMALADGGSFDTFLTNAQSYLAGIASAAAVLMITVGALMAKMSTDERGKERGKKVIMDTVILYLVILLGSWLVGKIKTLSGAA